MDDHDSVSSYFGPSLDKREAGPDAPLSPAEPVFPDITDLVTTIRNKVKKSKSAEQRIGFIDLGIAELTNKKREGEVEFHRLMDQNNLDDPDQYWSYDTALDKAINEFRLLRQRLILEDPELWPSPENKSEPQASPAQSMPAFAPPQGSTSSAESRTPPSDQMGVKDLAALLGMSESWIYKNYEAEGIPYFTLGTRLRFGRNEVIEWRDTKGKKARASVARVTVSRKPKAVPEISRSEPLASEVQSPQSVSQSDVSDLGVHPGILLKIEKLVSSLYKKGYLSQADSLGFKTWMLNGTRLGPNANEITWLKTRRSLVTCIVLCHYADLVSIPQTPGKTPPRPDFGATIERDFIAEGKSVLQNIDRDFAREIDYQIKVFIRMMRKDAEVSKFEFPEDLTLFSALDEYYDEIDLAGMDKEILVWDISTRNLLLTLHCPFQADQIELVAYDTLLIVKSRSVRSSRDSLYVTFLDFLFLAGQTPAILCNEYLPVLGPLEAWSPDDSILDFMRRLMIFNIEHTKEASA